MGLGDGWEAFAGGMLLRAIVARLIITAALFARLRDARCGAGSAALTRMFKRRRLRGCLSARLPRLRAALVCGEATTGRTFSFGVPDPGRRQSLLPLRFSLL